MAPRPDRRLGRERPRRTAWADQERRGFGPRKDRASGSSGSPRPVCRSCPWRASWDWAEVKTATGHSSPMVPTRWTSKTPYYCVCSSRCCSPSRISFRGSSFPARAESRAKFEGLPHDGGGPSQPWMAHGCLHPGESVLWQYSSMVSMKASAYWFSFVRPTPLILRNSARVVGCLTDISRRLASPKIT